MEKTVEYFLLPDKLSSYFFTEPSFLHLFDVIIMRTMLIYTAVWLLRDEGNKYSI